MEIMEYGDISDDQVLVLLKDAEQRLKYGGDNMKELETAEKHNWSSQSMLQTRMGTGPGQKLPQSYIKSTNKGAQIDSSLLVTNRERDLANGVRSVRSQASIKANATMREKATAGSDWYNLPRTAVTPELRRDLQLLRLRSVLDPHRHYKKETSRKNQIPEFSQVGTIVEGPTEFFSSRLTNKERKQTFVEEILAGEKVNNRFKSKYNEIQIAKTSGKKNHYKAIKTQRANRNSKG